MKKSERSINEKEINQILLSKINKNFAKNRDESMNQKRLKIG